MSVKTTKNIAIQVIKDNALTIMQNLDGKMYDVSIEPGNIYFEVDNDRGKRYRENFTDVYTMHKRLEKLASI